MSVNNNCCSGSSCCGPVESRNTVHVASTSLTCSDYFGAFKARWGIGRNNYTVEPGLYSVGTPDNTSPVLVSANYKLTFDTLRKNLTGINCRLLILDTKGVNVWCAAGKGTFGTEELVYRIEQTGLSKIVTHKQLILPQLGAPGINSNEVLKRSGFTVIYGPVRADDIRSFIADGFKATKEMREVRFSMKDRLVLTPIELVESGKILLPVFGVLFLINLFSAGAFGIHDFILYITAVLTGAFATPLLLPFIPGRAFAFKGWLLGLIGTAFVTWKFGWFSPPNLLLAIGYLLSLPALSSFLAMNFTGASTYTSPSGVLKEMKIAIPLILISALSGVVLILIKTFLG